MLYVRPIDQITWSDVETFCEQGIGEGSFLDYKQDFPTNLEKTIAAMANTLGGVILIGVAETPEGKPVAPLAGIPFQRGLSERVTNIILTNIMPPIFPEIGVTRDSTRKQAIVVLRIPQSHQTPHAIGHNTQVYLRTGNRNTPEALARIDEIEWLWERRGKSEELRERLYARAEQRFHALYDRQQKVWGAEGRPYSTVSRGWLTISLCPPYPKDPFLTPPEMNTILPKIMVREYLGTSRSFPLPDEHRGTIVQDGIVLSAAFHDNESVFHTELNCFGLYFYRQSLLRTEKLLNGQSVNAIRMAEIFCRLDEFLMSSVKLYRELGYWGILEFKMCLDRISSCAMVPYHPGARALGTSAFLYSPDNEVRFEETIPTPTLEEGTPALILHAVQRTAWAFGSTVTKDELDAYYKAKRR